MLDLATLCGLPVGLDERGLLVFGPDVVVEEHKERPLDALSPVAMQPEACRGRHEVAYYMDNGVYRRVDGQRLAGLPLRYELTLMPPRRMGSEFVKTLGHVHNPNQRSGLGPPEVYEVVAGTAHFLFHALDPSGPSAGKVFCVEARAGQKVVLPPCLGHLTINPGPEPLLVSDVVALEVTVDYEPFKLSRGAAYFEVCEGDRPRFVPNPTYRAVPPLCMLEPRDYPELALTRGEPLYTAFVRTCGEKWSFLDDPREFRSVFPDLALATLEW